MPIYSSESSFRFFPFFDCFVEQHLKNLQKMLFVLIESKAEINFKELTLIIVNSGAVFNSGSQ